MNAVKSSGLNGEDIGIVIVATSSPEDMFGDAPSVVRIFHVMCMQVFDTVYQNTPRRWSACTCQAHDVGQNKPALCISLCVCKCVHVCTYVHTSRGYEHDKPVP
jgi:hypothetical protein